MQRYHGAIEGQGAGETHLMTGIWQGPRECTKSVSRKEGRKECPSSSLVQLVPDLR
jgi:hypothetical protein